MDLSRLTKDLCKKYNIKPLRSKGQNFLITESVYDNIIKAADLNINDTVLEVGPGLGFLTERLASKVKKVIAVELDDNLAKFLKEETELLRFFFKKNRSNSVSIVNDNILDVDIKKLGLKNNKFKIVANLPYNITSIFLRKMLSGENKPKSMTLMLQKEVAERICARPPSMSLLAISVQFYANAEIIDYVGKENFWPEPKVDSAIIQLKINNYQLKNKNINKKEFFRLVKIGFSAKRKMLKNNLAGGFRINSHDTEEKLKKAGFSNKIRAGELSVPDWIKLMPYFY